MDRFYINVEPTTVLYLGTVVFLMDGAVQLKAFLPTGIVCFSTLFFGVDLVARPWHGSFIVVVLFYFFSTRSGFCVGCGPPLN